MTRFNSGRWALGVGFVLLMLPFANILHFVLPLPNLFGKSAWIVLPVGAFALIYLWLDRPWAAKSWLPFRPLLIAGALLIPVCLVRTVVYNEPAFPVNLRFAATMLVYIGLVEALLRRERFALTVLSRALILQGLLVSLLVFFNMNFYPTVRLEDNAAGLVGLTTTGFLTRSMLVNASVGANHILCAMLVLYAVLWQQCRKSARTLLGFWSAMIFMLYVVSLLGSRYPIAVALMLVALAAFQLRSARSFVAMLCAVILLALLNVGVVCVQNMLVDSNMIDSLQLSKPNIRYQEDSGSRGEKALLAIKILSGSTKNLVIGASIQEIATSRSAQGVAFSDNSYASVMLQVGVPMALLFFMLWGRFLRSYAHSPLGYFCLAYLAGVLMLTNGYLWESWLCVVLFSLVVVARLSVRAGVQDKHI